MNQGSLLNEGRLKTKWMQNEVLGNGLQHACSYLQCTYIMSAHHQVIALSLNAHIILSYYRQLITLPTKPNFAESSGRRQGLYHSQEMGHNDLEPYFDLSGASIYT